MLGYSRKSISDYYKRFEKRSLFKQHLLRYLGYTSTRQSLSIQHCFKFENIHANLQNPIHTLPFIDKCGFYSIFVSAIYDLIFSGKKHWYIEDIVELVLPIGWLTTGTHYYKVLQQWKENGIPPGNLTLCLLEDLIKMGGSISSGPGPRLQPFCNTPISKGLIFQGLQKLLDTIVKLNSSHDFLLQEAMKDITQIHSVGYIGAQHILASLTLLRIIHNTQYVRETILLKTGTSTKIKKFYGLTEPTINMLYKEVASETFDGCSRKVENLVCEFFRDIKKPLDDWNRSTYILSVEKRLSGSSVKFPDSFYPSQKLFVEEACKVFRYSYNKNGQVERVQLNVLSFPNNKLCNWRDNFNENELVLVKGEVDQKLYSSKTSSKRQRLRRTSELVLKSTEVSLNEMVEDNQYDFVQQDIIRMLDKHKVFHSTNKFDMKNSWFEGVTKTFDGNHIVKMLTSEDKKTKKTKKSKRSIGTIRYSEPEKFSFDKTKKIWTTYTTSMNQCIYLSSKSSNMLDNNYAESKVSYITSRRDVVSFYFSQEYARKALILKVMTEYKESNALQHGYLSKFLKQNREKYVALFEKKDNINQFFGLISQRHGDPAIYVPTDEKDELKASWQKYIFQTE